MDFFFFLPTKKVTENERLEYSYKNHFNQPGCACALQTKKNVNISKVKIRETIKTALKSPPPSAMGIVFLGTPISYKYL